MEKGAGVALSTAGVGGVGPGRLLPVLLLGPDPGLLVLLGPLGVHLAAGLALPTLLALLSLLALLVLRQELAGLGVTRLVFGFLVLELPELLGVAPVLGALVGTATLLAGEAGLLSRRLLSRRDVPLLLAAHPLLRLLSRLLLWLLARLLSLGLLLSLLHLGLLAPLLGLLSRLLLAQLLCLGLLLAHLLCLGLLTHLLGLWLLAHLLGLWLLAHLLGLWLLALLSALRSRRQELSRLGVTRSLLCDLAHPLAELLGVAPVLGALVGAAALLAGEAGLLTGRLLSRRDVPLLLCRLLARSLLWLGLLLLERSLLSWLVLETHSDLPRAEPASSRRPARVWSPGCHRSKLPAGCSTGSGVIGIAGLRLGRVSRSTPVLASP